MLERKAPGHNLQVPGNSEEDLLFCAAGWGFACPCLIPRFACVVSVLEERWLLRAAPVPVDWKSGNSQEQNPFLSSLLTPPALPEPPKFPCLQPAQSLGKLIPLIVPWARLLLLLTFSLALPAGNTLSTTLQPAAERISKEIQAVKSHPSAPAVQPGIFTGRWKPNSKNKAWDRDQEVLCGFSWDLRVSPPWEGI